MNYSHHPVWVNGRRCATIKDAAMYMELGLREIVPDTRVYYDRLAYALRQGQDTYLGYAVSMSAPRPRHMLADTWTAGTPLLRGHVTHRLGAYRG